MRVGTHRFPAVLFAVLCGSVTLTAQSTGHPNHDSPQVSSEFSAKPQVYVVPDPAMEAGCPVSMRAQHGSGGGLVMTGRRQPGNHSNPDGQSNSTEQRIHLVLGNTPDSAKNFGRVVVARVTVHGTNGKGRVLQAFSFGAESTAETWSAAKTLDLKLDSTDDGVQFADMALPGFSSVHSITLDSLTFADGSMWNSFNGRACRVAPDPFMLVTAR
jgi:hypothetical protein